MTATDSNPVQGEDSKLNVTATELVHSASGSQGRAGSLSHVASVSGRTDRQRKAGVPSDDDLLNLSAELGAKWTMLSSALGTPKARIEAIDDENKQMVDKSYDSLLSWKQRNGCEATYQVLEAGLCHDTVEGRILAEKYCYERIVS